MEINKQGTSTQASFALLGCGIPIEDDAFAPPRPSLLEVKDSRGLSYTGSSCNEDANSKLEITLSACDDRPDDLPFEVADLTMDAGPLQLPLPNGMYSSGTLALSEWNQHGLTSFDDEPSSMQCHFTYEEASVADTVPTDELHGMIRPMHSDGPSISTVASSVKENQDEDNCGSLTDSCMEVAGGDGIAPKRK